MYTYIYIYTHNDNNNNNNDKLLMINYYRRLRCSSFRVIIPRGHCFHGATEVGNFPRFYRSRERRESSPCSPAEKHRFLMVLARFESRGCPPHRHCKIQRGKEASISRDEKMKKGRLRRNDSSRIDHPTGIRAAR